MMARCEQVIPLIGPFADGELAGRRRLRVEQHLAGCGRCRERQALLLAQAQALREVLARRAAEADFDGFAERVLRRARLEKPAGARRLPAWLDAIWTAHRRTFAAAGGLALAASLMVAVLLRPFAPADDAALLADASAPQVEQVDFGTQSGAVLQLPRETTVIWMSDEAPQ